MTGTAAGDGHVEATDDLAVRSITEVAGLIERRELSPVELVGAVLSRIERLEPLLNAYITVFADSATQEARVAADEIARGGYHGALHGIPVGIKDTLAVAGHPTTNGSLAMADHVTDFDAAVVERLREAGAVVVGKNSLHEWAMGGTCTGMPFGTVGNPWDPSRVPGGSSGGSAAAVSAGLAFASIGTDGWGSIRTPASYCGVVGLKPSAGLVSRFGELPPTSSPQHQVGPITRSVDDAALVLSAIAGHDPRDPTSLQRAFPVDDSAPGVAGLRIGLPTSYFHDDAIPAVAAAVSAAAERFAELGATIREVDIPSLRHLPLALVGARYEGQSILAPLALDRPDAFVTPGLRATILAGEFITETDARRSRQVRSLIRSEVRAVLDDVDVVLTPSNSTTAFPHGAASVTVGDGATVDLRAPGGQSRITTRLTLPWNLAGVPSIALPTGELHEGLPTSIHLAAAHWRDGLLLRAAGAFEAAVGGYRVPPAVAAPATAPERRPPS